MKHTLYTWLLERLEIYKRAVLIFLRKYKIILIFLTLFSSIYGSLFSFRYEIQAHLFFPGIQINTIDYTGDGIPQSNLKFEDINITSLDGKNINGLYIDSGAEKTIYYIHGNGGDLRYFYPTLELLASWGYNIAAIDFPGYGKSGGFPYNAEVLSFTDTFYNYLKKEKGLEEKNTIVWWYSIGSGVAVEWLKDKQNIHSLVLAAPYSSWYDLSRQHYIFALQKLFFLPDSFVSLLGIKSLHIPILFLHGNADALVFIEQGREVFENSVEGYFLEVDTGTHYNTLQFPVSVKLTQDFLKDSKLPERYIYISSNPVDVDEYVFTPESLDMETDDSITKYVDPENPFNALWYIPEDYELFSRSFISDTKWDAGLRHEARVQFEELAKAFYKEFGEKIVVVSSYRSYNYQVWIKAGWCPDNLCAKAGYSEHQSGLALDLWSASSNEYWKTSSRLMKFYDWLDKNAYLYGFENSYKNGKSIDGYEIEPWHWRYLWIDFATYLHQRNFTFAQYYYEKNPKN